MLGAVICGAGAAQTLVEPGQAGVCCQGIAQEARRELLRLPAYGVFDDLKFTWNGKVLILSGEATCPELRDDAAVVATTLPGVRTVQNKIVVLAPSASDNRLRMAEFQAIYGNQKLGWYARRAAPPIRIIVNHGSIKLEGTVASEGDRKLAGVLAGGVTGASSVMNELQIEP
jgi:hyperosmotically inducible protein